MNFVDEQYIAAFQVGQQRGQITRSLKHRSGSALDRTAHFFGDDIGQGGLTQARRAEDQRMVECFHPTPRSLDEQRHLFAHDGLTDVVGQTQRTNGSILLLFALAGGGGNQAISFDHRGIPLKIH